MAAGEIDAHDQGLPYPAATRVVAAVATIVAPFISLVVASVLLSSESDPVRRGDLKTWRIASAVWLALGAVLAIAVFAAIASEVGGTSGACRGGRDEFTPASYYSDDGKHWTATYSCVGGGSTTVPVPANRVPGGLEP